MHIREFPLLKYHMQFRKSADMHQYISKRACALLHCQTDFPKYDGSIHPNEWINNIQNISNLRKSIIWRLLIAISLVDIIIISLPAEINSFEKLCNAFKEDVSFTVLKNTNKRKLQLLTVKVYS